MKDHTYEEIRSAANDRLSGREPRYSFEATQYLNLQAEVAVILNKRDPCPIPDSGRPPNLSSNDWIYTKKFFGTFSDKGLLH